MPKPTFSVPRGTTALLYMIDTTFRLSNVNSSGFLGPPVEHFDFLPVITTWSFLVESSTTGQKALFDLGVPPSLDSYSPPLAAALRSTGWVIESDKNVADILRDGGVEPAEVESLIWSHEHFDHIGDPTTFPNTTELVVGQGFKDALLPAWPTRESGLRESYFEGRTFREADFSASNLTVGFFPAVDFFSDGSFYLLDTPGHTIGHLGALVRTTSGPEGDSFVFLGGDLCHHGSEIRPSPHAPLPDSLRVPLHLPLSPGDTLRASHSASCCIGGELFRQLNRGRGRAADEPIFEPVSTSSIDPEATKRTIARAQEADVQSNVLFVFAHDMAVKGIVDEFPKPMNGWKAKGWREEAFWRFLSDLLPAVGGCPAKALAV